MVKIANEAKIYYFKNKRIPKGWVYDGGKYKAYTKDQAVNRMEQLKKDGYRSFFFEEMSQKYRRYICHVVRTSTKVLTPIVKSTRTRRPSIGKLKRYKVSDNKFRSLAHYRDTSHKGPRFESDDVTALKNLGFKVPYAMDTGFGSWITLKATGTLREVETEAKRMISLGYDTDPTEMIIVSSKKRNANSYVFALYAGDSKYKPDPKAAKIGFVQDKQYKRYYTWNFEKYKREVLKRVD